MIVIDGSHMEGGGQIVRTAIALSAINQEPTRIENIRAGRCNPGLKNQHLYAIKTAAEICHAEVEGLELGSNSVTFYPKGINGGDYKIDIKTAGSITLLLQLLIPITLFSEEKTTLKISGGTDVKWSPSSEYFKNIFLAFLKHFGIDISYEIKSRGFYPKGGGEIVFKSFPWKNKKRVNISERGKLKEIFVNSVASEQLKKAKVAERQINGFKKVMKPNKKSIEYSTSLSPGSILYSQIEYENLKIGATSLGEKGKKAEIIGEMCGEELKSMMGKKGIDKYLADQIIPYVAIAGGRIMASEISKHTKTNIWVCQKFGYNIGIENNEIIC